MNWLRTYSATIILFILLIVAVTLLLRSCDKRREAEDQARGAAIGAEGTAAQGRDAIGTIGNNAKGEAEIDKTTAATRDAINSAKGAQDAISPELDAATRARLCMRVTFRCQPSCVQLLGACPK